MDKKEQIVELLSNLSEEDLTNLTNLLQTKTTKKAAKKTAKKRTPRKKTTRKKATKKKTGPDLLQGVQLNPQEQQELGAAIKFDKAKGFDKPKEGGIIPKGPLFQKISIKCMECRKEFQVSPALIPPEADRFRCNSCSCRGHPQR
mgnify:CR=1 FL=1